jgi:hypothetical protein
MIDYNDPNDPNYDSYWGDKETSRDEPADCPDLSDHEFEELGETYVKSARRRGLVLGADLTPPTSLPPT